MAAFQDTREQTEQKVMVHLLSEIERNPSFTQRSLAGELGIALGLMNQVFKTLRHQRLGPGLSNLSSTNYLFSNP